MDDNKSTKDDIGVDEKNGGDNGDGDHDDESCEAEASAFLLTSKRYQAS